MRTLFVCMVSLALSFAFVACDGASDKEPHKGDGGPDQSSSRPKKDYSKVQMTADKTCKVEYSLSDKAEWPPKNKNFTLNVTVLDKDGKAEGEFDIKVNADMPEHGHGMNTTPKVERTGKNTFQVSGMLMHMRGWWEIYVEVTKGCGPSKATFNTFIE